MKDRYSLADLYLDYISNAGISETKAFEEFEKENAIAKAQGKHFGADWFCTSVIFKDGSVFGGSLYVKETDRSLDTRYCSTDRH